MPSFHSLMVLGRGGDPGELLAKEFKGQFGTGTPGADGETDIKVHFNSEVETPSVEAISLALVVRYTALGYTVEVSPPCEDMVSVSIFFQEKKRGQLRLNISTRYALVEGGEHSHVWISAIALGPSAEEP